jgi:hypothetical protein
MYTLTTEPYYDSKIQKYINIIRINMIPEGPLHFFVRRIKIPVLNVNKNYSDNTCFLVLQSFLNNNRYMTPDDIPNLFSYLINNNYEINTSLTNMLNKGDVRLNNQNIICFFSYKSKNMI